MPGTATPFSIRADIQALESLSSDFSAFFDRWSGESLFRRRPPRAAADDVERRIREGRYLLRPCRYELREEPSALAAYELLDILAHHLPERRAAVEQILQVFVGGQSEPFQFVSRVFRNRGDELVRFQRQFALEEDLVACFAVMLTRPYRSLAARMLAENLNLAEWTRGYCPVCGHWPSLGHLRNEDGKRTLWCLQCGTCWDFKRLQCPFCLNESQDFLTVFSLEEEDFCRVHACRRCHRFLREIRSDRPVSEFPFLQNALGTVGLDVLAQQEGFIRESPLIVRYADPDGNELLLYRQLLETPDSNDRAESSASKPEESELREGDADAIRLG